MASVRSLREFAQFAVMKDKLALLKHLRRPGLKCASWESVFKIVDTILATAPLLLLEVLKAITAILNTNKSVALLAEWKTVLNRLHTCLAYVNPTIRVNGSHELFYKEVIDAMKTISYALKAAFPNVYKSGGPDTQNEYEYLYYNPLLFFSLITRARVTQKLADFFLDQLSISSCLNDAFYSDDMEIAVRKTANLNEYTLRIADIDIADDCGNAISSILLSVENIDESSASRVVGGCLIALSIPTMYLHFMRRRLGAEAIAMTNMFELNYWTAYTIRAVEHAIDLVRSHLTAPVNFSTSSIHALSKLALLDSPGSAQLYKKIVTLFFDIIERLHARGIRDLRVLMEILPLLSLDTDAAPEEYRIHEIMSERQRALTLRDYFTDSNIPELVQNYRALQDRIRGQNKEELKSVFAYIP